MGARNRVGIALSRNSVVIPARQATQPGGISSLQSIFRLLKSLKIRDQENRAGIQLVEESGDLNKIVFFSV
jgi:hypothetical protein